ncbi:MAG: T9SS type A sorting domain-containing protein [Bacteroidetes bacterium]|nr:T9SS type A sorting domain-containing protein [Bacteroidota bacterium]
MATLKKEFKTVVCYAVICTLLLCNIPGISQSNTFSKILTGQPMSVQTCAMTKDSSFIIAGQAGDGACLKIDAQGNPLWAKLYDINSNVSPETLINDVLTDADSSIIITGRGHNSVQNKTGALIARLKPNGDTLWWKLLAPPGFTSMEAANVILAKDSSYTICGLAGAYVNPQPQCFVANISRTGNVNWFKMYATGNSRLMAQVIKLTQDSGYIFTGFEGINNSPYFATILVKINKAGIVQWSKKYACQKPETGRGGDVIINSSGYLCYINTGNISLLQTDFSGNVLWSKDFDKPFPGYAYNVFPYNSPRNCFHRLKDKGYTFVTGKDSVYYLIKTDSILNPVWTKQVKLIPKDVLECNNGDFVIIGSGVNNNIGIIKTNSIGIGQGCTTSATTGTLPVTFTSSLLTVSSSMGASVFYNSPVTQTMNFFSSNGCVVYTIGVGEKKMFSGGQIFPNPASDYLNFNGFAEVNDKLTFELYSPAGSLYLVKHFSPGEEKIIRNLNVNPGLYFFNLFKNDILIERNKILIEK